MKNIALLGSTGSIGRQTLEVVEEFPQDFKVQILAAHGNWQLIMEQAKRFAPHYIVLTDTAAFEQLKVHWQEPSGQLLCGMEELLKVLADEPLDLVVGAMGGAIGIEPTLKALSLGIDVALANKETLVAGGDLVRAVQQKTGAKILPVDSEHSAIFQCMEQEGKCVSRILLTASGGPFRQSSLEELREVKPAAALKHPNWSMGRKITIDSATLMNKGLEVIEANWLFNMPYDQIKVLVHPQSVIHSMVEYGDGSVLAHLGRADMRIPIQYALTYPERQANTFPKLDFTQLSGLTFHEVDHEKFPALQLAYAAGRTGRSLPVVLNAANEVAVQAFLEERLSFLGIPALVEKVMARHEVTAIDDLAHLMAIDGWARAEAQKLLAQMN